MAMDTRKILMPMKWGKLIASLTAEQAGVLIKTIYQYEQTGEYDEIQDPLVKLAFETNVQITLDEARSAYTARCESNHENGKKGGRPSTKIPQKAEKEKPKNRTVIEEKTSGKNEKTTALKPSVGAEENPKKPFGFEVENQACFEGVEKTQKANGFFNNPNKDKDKDKDKDKRRGIDINTTLVNDSPPGKRRNIFFSEGPDNDG